MPILRVNGSQHRAGKPFGKLPLFTVPPSSWLGAGVAFLVRLQLAIRRRADRPTDAIVRHILAVEKLKQ
jgi:hypothetical protein